MDADLRALERAAQAGNDPEARERWRRARRRTEHWPFWMPKPGTEIYILDSAPSPFEVRLSGLEFPISPRLEGVEYLVSRTPCGGYHCMLCPPRHNPRGTGRRRRMKNKRRWRKKRGR